MIEIRYFVHQKKATYTRQVENLEQAAIVLERLYRGRYQAAAIENDRLVGEVYKNQDDHLTWYCEGGHDD